MAEERKCSSTTCSKDSCKGCDKAQVDFSVKPNELTHVKKVIGVVSGKGGVGKSLVTSLLAVTMNKRGHQWGSWMRILQDLLFQRLLGSGIR